MIKRGVSLYSYQQEQFFKRMNMEDMVKEVRQSLNTDGIEIIDQSMVRDYPFPTDAFVADFRNTLAKYEMKAVTMDIYLDTMQFRDHVLNHHEAAERLMRDIDLAKKLGFQNVRCLSAVPIDVIEMALPHAEAQGVRIGKEIHAPCNITPLDPTRKISNVRDPHLVEQIVELADRKNSKFVGLVPDMGIFQYRMNKPNFDYLVRHGANPTILAYVDEVIAQGVRDIEEAKALAAKKFPDATNEELDLMRNIHMFSVAKPEEIKAIVPYIISIHGKFYQMTEVAGEPGHYIDESINYKDTIYWLKQGGYDGYINSEYEGQRHQQDRGMEYLADEVEEVRRHHEMLARYIAE